jgi:hypothetical protein
VPVLMTAQCCEFPTCKGSRFQAVYDWNCVWNGVTSYEAPESRSQLVASSVISRTSASAVLSTLRMFGSSSGVTLTVLRKVVGDEPRKFTSFVRLTLCVNFPLSCRTAPNLRASWMMTSGALDEEK